MSEALFFRDKNELLKWFKKNYKKSGQWIGLYKKAVRGQGGGLSMSEVADIALRFGWSGVVIKSIDVWSYQIKFGPRKKGSTWSSLNIKRFNELKKQGLVHPAGLKAFAERGKEKPPEKSELSETQLKQFKKNKKAWDFFNTQAVGYRKYMTYWVASAKREETQQKRLTELINDSANGTKLQRILKAQEKAKPRYEEGKTPVEAGRNLGLASGADLRAVQINTLEQLKRMGWEKALTKVCEVNPRRLNLNFFYSVVGAIEDQSWRELDGDLKAQARDLLSQLKSG